MKLFLRRLLYFLPVPLVIMGVNYYVDPANLFKNGRYEAGIANYLVKGYHVKNVSNYDERLFQKYFIEKMTACPDEIILGSSTIMLIGQQYGQGKLINSGVSGGTLEDDLAIFSLYEKKGCTNIKKVSIGMDAFILNDHHGQTRWTVLKDEYQQFANKLHLPVAKKVVTVGGSKWKELFSVSYFKSSVNYIKKICRQGGANQYTPTKDTANSEFTKKADGSICYDVTFRSASAAIVDERALHTTESVPVYSLGHYDSLSARYKNMLHVFVAYLQEKGIAVEFILAPYHPMVYEYLEKSKLYSNVPKAEKYFRAYAEQHHIKVIGSFNPAIFSLDKSFYYDGLHCNEEAIAIMMADTARRQNYK